MPDPISIGDGAALGAEMPQTPNLARQHLLENASSPFLGLVSDKLDSHYDLPVRARNPTNKELASLPFGRDELDHFAAEATSLSDRQVRILQSLGRSLNDAVLALDPDDRTIASPLCRELLSLWTRMTGLDGRNPSARSSSPPILTPQSSPPPTYAGVAKSPFAQGTKTTTGRQGQQAPRPAKPRQDTRVLVEVAESERTRRTINQNAVRAHIIRNNHLDLTKIAGASQTRTGWAIFTDGPQTQTAIIKTQDQWLSGIHGTSAYARTEWVTYAVPNTRRQVDFLDARATITMEMVMEEALAQTGQRPVNAHPSRHDDGMSDYMTWIISFLKPTKGRWTLFGDSSYASKCDKPRAVDQCNKCWDFHPTFKCNNDDRCVRCGDKPHGTCTRHAHCANCLGHHQADFSDCPLRPRREGDRVRRASRKQTHMIRERNQAERNETPRTHFQAPIMAVTSPTRDSSPMAELRPEGKGRRPAAHGSAGTELPGHRTLGPPCG